MAFSCGFFNNLNNDSKYRYNAEQLSSIFDGIISDGVYANYKQAFVVRASSNDNEVIVQPGRAWLLHTWSYNDADLPVVAPESELVLDRIDALVIDVNTEPEVRWNEIKWVQGTPASEDVQRPTLVDETFHKQYPLCYVYRAAGTTTIAAENITNMVGTSELPFVTGIIESIDITTLLAQWQAQFDNWNTQKRNEFESWEDAVQSDFETWKDNEENDFEDWFQHLHDELDENQAAHLQNEIDDINNELDKFTDLLTGTIAAGATSVTIQDESILTTSIVDIYFEDKVLAPTEVTVTTGQIVIEINPQTSSTVVGVRILEGGGE